MHDAMKIMENQAERIDGKLKPPVEKIRAKVGMLIESITRLFNIA